MAGDAGGKGRRTIKRVLPIAVSVLLLAGLWWRIDLHAVLGAVRQARPAWVAAGIVALVPLMWGSAIRFQWLSRAHIGTALSCRLLLAASTLNLFLPSKMGDLAKAWVLDRRHGFDGKFALALVVLEKMLDLASLLVWGVLALAWMRPGDPLFLLGAAGVVAVLALLMFLMTPLSARFTLPRRLGAFSDEWHGLIRWFWSDRRRALATWGLSLALWAGHLAQLWLFARALAYVPVASSAAAATLSILAGLLPFTMGGIGIRDLAIVYFFRAWLSPAQCAALGMLATLRYLLPAIVGLPFVSDYWKPAERAA